VVAYRIQTRHFSQRIAAFPHDPFDRMLIAQAPAENLTVVTKDPNFPPYGVATVW